MVFIYFVLSNYVIGNNKMIISVKYK